MSDKTIAAEGSGSFYYSLGNASKNVGKNIQNSPVRAIELAGKITSVAASKNPRGIAAAAPDIRKLVHQGKGLYLDKVH